MTIAEAISVLNMVEAYGIADDAKKMAIRSLEAWDKVTEEIGELHDTDDAYWNGVYDCLNIIIKHFKEVTE